MPDPRQGRTLVFCPVGIGNVLMATPALKALSDALSPERVAVLALKPAVADMARASGLFSEVYVWDPDREGLGRGVACLRQMRAERFTHSLALFPSANWKASLFERLVAADFRMGFAYPHDRGPGWVQHRSLPLEPVHDVFQDLRLVKAFLGAPADPIAPFFPGVPEVPAGLPPEPFFACHPGSSMERGMAEKRLPPETFASLITRAFAETGWRCVLTGGPEEAELREAVASRCREAIIPVAIRSLGETAGVLGRARFFLGNDSGLMHLAAAMGTRCAAYFGPTDERRTGPFGYWETIGGVPRHLVLRKAGSSALWTLATIGRNPPIDRAAAAGWALDAEEAWTSLRPWIASLETVSA